MNLRFFFDFPKKKAFFFIFILKFEEKYFWKKKTKFFSNFFRKIEVWEYFGLNFLFRI